MIYHYSHVSLRKEIEESSYIGLEGCRLEYFIAEGLHLNQPKSAELSFQWRTMKKEYKARGRYVWFTEQPFSYAIGSLNLAKVRYAFNPQDIKAYSWPSLMEIASKDKQRFSIMKEVSEFGMGSGDDPFKWWVTFEEVSLKNCRNISEVGYFEPLVE